MSESSNAAADQTQQALDEALPIGPGAGFTFFYYFATAAFIITLLTARTLDVSLITPLPGEVGLLGGLIAGTLGAVFNRSQTLEVDFDNQKQFRQQLQAALATMRYSLASTDGPLDCYQRPNASRFFAGDIYVQQRERCAIIVSRAGNIRTLEKLLSQ